MDEKQFRSCLMPLHKNLYACAFAILRNEDDAADCLQESFTRLWECRHRLDKLDNVAAYAAVTVKNIAVSMASSPARKISVIDRNPDNDSDYNTPEIADPLPSPSDRLEAREDVRHMTGLLRRLPENQRKVVLLSAVAGLSNPEIRDATGLSDDNVRVLLSRGRRKLKDLFSKL